MKNVLFFFALFTWLHSEVNAQTRHQPRPQPRPETRELCQHQQPPSGWLVISYRDTDCCRRPATVRKPTIQRIDALPSGTILDICTQPIPSGWVVISQRQDWDCTPKGSTIRYSPTIKRIEGLPSGTTVEICLQPTPEGWETIGYESRLGRCETGFARTKIIRKL